MIPLHSIDTCADDSDGIGGKARKLKLLSSLEGVSVPVFTCVSGYGDEAEARRVIRSFLSAHPHVERVAVRSSAEGEDGHKASFAGALETFLNVPADEDAVVQALMDIRLHAKQKDAVLRGYATARSARYDGTVGVVVQEMVRDPDLSGVMFSHDPQRDDGYIHVHFHEGLGDDLVSGTSRGTDIRVLRGNAPTDGAKHKFPFLENAMRSMQAVEQGLRSESIDVEFAVKNGRFFVLQARQLTAARESDHSSAVLGRYAARVQNAVRDMLAGGDRLGDMIDINPRELLGERPHPINTSIFRKMFADDVVENVRREMGYEPAGSGLVRDVAGRPYVSLLASAHSFRPRGVSAETYRKLAQHYVGAMDGDPSLQDRVEFELFFMNASEESRRHLEGLEFLSDDEKQEILNGLREIDRSIDRIAGVEMERVTDAMATPGDAPLSDIVSALRSQTATFVRNARLAFYYRNLVEREMGEGAAERVLTGIRTPSTDMQDDLHAYACGDTDESMLLERYGHMRPGQLDMFSSTYASDIVHFLGLSRLDRDFLVGQMRRREAQRAEGDAIIAALGTEKEREMVVRLRAFMERRERVKFDFMKTFDLLVKRIQAAAEQLGLDQRLLQQASFDEVLALCGEREPDVPRDILYIALRRRAGHENIRRILQLPSVFVPSTSDLIVIEQMVANATYITDEIVSSDVALVSKDSVSDMEGLAARVQGSIVVLDAADPGYDFLFAMQPAGLVTCVGGPASHMAIRSIELGIPAAIGIGKGVFDDVRAADRATLDCERKQIIIHS